MSLGIRLHQSQRRAMLVVVGLVVVSRVGMSFAMDALNIHLKKEPVAIRRGLADVPRILGQWEAVGDDQRLSEEFIEELGTDQFLTRSYEHTDGRFLQLHLAYYTGMIDASATRPRSLFGGDRWVRPGAIARKLATQHQAANLEQN